MMKALVGFAVLMAGCADDSTIPVEDVNAMLAGTWTVNFDDTSKSSVMVGFAQASDEPYEKAGSCAAPPCFSIATIDLSVTALDGYGGELEGVLGVGNGLDQASLRITIGTTEARAEVDSKGTVKQIFTPGIQLIHAR